MSGKVPIRATFRKSVRLNALKNELMIDPAKLPSRLTGYNIGWPTDSKYDRGERDPIPTSVVAKIQEFGSPSEDGTIAQGNNSGIPARPFFSAANDEFHKFIIAFVRFSQRVGLKKLDAKDTHFIAKRHVALVKASIVNGDWEANKPETVKKKKSDQPLIDTRQLFDEVTYATTTGKR